MGSFDEKEGDGCPKYGSDIPSTLEIMKFDNLLCFESEFSSEPNTNSNTFQNRFEKFVFLYEFGGF